MGEVKVPAKPELHIGMGADKVGDGPWITRVVEPCTAVLHMHIVQHLSMIIHDGDILK